MKLLGPNRQTGPRKGCQSTRHTVHSSQRCCTRQSTSDTIL